MEEGSEAWHVQQKYMKLIDLVLDKILQPMEDAQNRLNRINFRLQLDALENAHVPRQASTEQGRNMQRAMTGLAYFRDQIERLTEHLRWMMTVQVPEPEPEPEPELRLVDDDPAGDDAIDSLLDALAGGTSVSEPSTPRTETPAETPESAESKSPRPVADVASNDEYDVGIEIPEAKPKPQLSFQGMPCTAEETEEFKAFQIWKYENEQRENLILLRKRKIEELKKAKGA